MFGIKHGKTNGKTVTEQEVLGALARIQDPDLRKDIVSLGFVKDLAIDSGKVSFKIELTTPACPVKGEMERQAREYVAGLPGVEQVSVSMTSQVRANIPAGTANLVPGVRNVIALNEELGAFDGPPPTVERVVDTSFWERARR